MCSVKLEVLLFFTFFLMIKFISFFNKKISFSLPLWSLLLIPFVAYWGWEIFWFQKVGLNVIKLHTHFMFLGTMGLFFIFFITFYLKNSSKQNFYLLIVSSTFLLLLIEFILAITGTNKTYLEKASGFYSSPYQGENSHYHSWTPLKPHWIKKPEYAYLFPTNSLGFADSNWNLNKEAHVKRIICLGDSFTEGDGAPYDSSYVALLKKYPFQTSPPLEWINGGICGSDFFHNYKNLKDLLLPYKPDMILQTLASHDFITDIRLRGGMERFSSDGTMNYKNAPWWEPLYAVNYLSRFFFHALGYNELLQKKELAKQEIKTMNEITIQLFNEYEALCEKNNIQWVLILRPDKNEILDRHYSYDFEPILQKIQTYPNVKILNLLPAYQEYIELKGTKVENYFWKNDGHHNSKGYQMMAECVAQFLEKENMLIEPEILF